MTGKRTGQLRWRFTDGTAPRAPHLATMTWRHGLFANWPVDPDELRPHIPNPLRLETWDGNAWVSILPFVLTNAGVRGSPAATRTAFPELNVRTYVTHRGDPGLFFLSVDLDKPLLANAIGRLTRLPVFNADMSVSGTEDGITFSSRRSATNADLPDPNADTDDRTAWFATTYRPNGPVTTAEPGTLEYWLTERRQFYAPEDGSVLAGEIAHDPWPLQPADATILENTMFELHGLPEPTAEPVCYYCDELEMTGSIPRRVR
ncbi:DUF2071 family protein [Natrialba magadii ATCC 43099]|uniref:DUF2071 family protein n=1 Tax=Natrialba magadii (strain ATCC 43099 / DSM 3394 / CCM 3739 / CIP 104546 / IAM 13178 / JCM 8861 / NBRC 102185 / NCIMB 2190 / MS3) TaxID=547559 RepID=D3SW13_NATMM|nr:DUF2071 domain-containing protein [Natrialba magadii]ADD05674.1 DUF2071 family protein [Natrialba magadii ATCC 43099]ELY29914.1 hypothetical protein C500_09899 [Natrialba magadii ATCC 43099]